MIEITTSPIDHAALTERVRSDLAGAVCTFLGTVREMTGGRRTASLDYEATLQEVAHVAVRPVRTAPMAFLATAANWTV